MLLGDVGGLSGIFYAIGAWLVNFLTYNKSENFLAHKLFVIDAKDKGIDIGVDKGADKGAVKEMCLNPQKQFALLEYLQNLLP